MLTTQRAWALRLSSMQPIHLIEFGQNLPARGHPPVGPRDRVLSIALVVSLALTAALVGGAVH